MALFCCGSEFLNEFRPGCSLRDQGALLRVAAEEEEVVFLEFDADDVAAPFCRGKSIFGHGAHDLRIALIVASLDRVLIVEFDRVVKNAELSLDPVVRGGHFRTGDEGVPADGRHLFENDDGGPVVLRFDRGRESGAAGSDYNHVVDASFRNFCRFLHDGNRSGKNDARFSGCFGHGRFKGFRRNGSARNRVDGCGVARDHCILKVGEDSRRKDFVFVRFDDVDSGDAAGIKCDFRRHVAVLPDAGAGCDNRCCRGRRNRERCRNRRQSGSERNHSASPFGWSRSQYCGKPTLRSVFTRRAVLGHEARFRYRLLRKFQKSAFFH